MWPWSGLMGTDLTGTPSFADGAHRMLAYEAPVAFGAEHYHKMYGSQAGVYKGDCAVRPTHARSKPVLFYHISKAGGTMMCKLARQLGEAVVQPETNCNWEGVDFGRHHASKGQGAVSCEAREKHFSRQGATWGSIEEPLDTSDLCHSDFLYATVLREPSALGKSRVLFDNVINFREHLECVEKRNQKLCERAMARYNATSSHHALGFPTWKAFDNIMVRMLAGPEAFHLPVGRITAAHLAIARKRLADFQLILKLDELDHQPAAAGKQLSGLLGWDSEYVARLLKDSHVNEGAAEQSPIKFSGEDSTRIAAIVRGSFDEQLYQS